MRLMNRSMVFCALSFFLAQEMALANPKLGFVDYDKAIKEEKEAQVIFKELEAKEIALATWEQDAKNKFEKEMNTYKEQMPKWKEEKRKTEEAKLSAKINELQQESARRRQELSSDQQAKLEELKLKNLRLVDEIAKKQSYAMIFNAATLVYVSDDMKKKFDITTDLVKAYNEKYKAPLTPPPAAPAPAVPAPALPAKPDVKTMPGKPAVPGPSKPEVKPAPIKPGQKPAPAA